MSRRTLMFVVLDWGMALLATAILIAPVRAGEKSREIRTGEEAILQALEEKTQLDFVETPLTDVIAFFEDAHQVEIEIDQRALGDVGIGTDSPITKTLKGVTFRSALNLLLRDLDLAWTIKDEVLLITTHEAAEQMLLTRIYDVADLVTFHTPGGQAGQDFDSLIEAIRSNVEPQNWDAVGGPGAITPLEYRGAKVVVVRQTFQIHEQIRRLLKGLRAVADQYGKDVFPVRESGEKKRGHDKAPAAEMPGSSGAAGHRGKSS